MGAAKQAAAWACSAQARRALLFLELVLEGLPPTLRRGVFLPLSRGLFGLTNLVRSGSFPLQSQRIFATHAACRLVNSQIVGTSLELALERFPPTLPSGVFRSFARPLMCTWGR